MRRFQLWGVTAYNCICGRDKLVAGSRGNSTRRSFRDGRRENERFLGDHRVNRLSSSRPLQIIAIKHNYRVASIRDSRVTLTRFISMRALIPATFGLSSFPAVFRERISVVEVTRVGVPAWTRAKRDRAPTTSSSWNCESRRDAHLLIPSYLCWCGCYQGRACRQESNQRTSSRQRDCLPAAS